MTLLKSIMEGNDAYGVPLDNWKQSIQTIVIPHDISDKRLLYVAERLAILSHSSLLCKLIVMVLIFVLVIWQDT